MRNLVALRDQLAREAASERHQASGAAAAPGKPGKPGCDLIPASSPGFPGSAQGSVPDDRGRPAATAGTPGDFWDNIDAWLRFHGFHRVDPAELDAHVLVPPSYDLGDHALGRPAEPSPRGHSRREVGGEGTGGRMLF